MDEFEKRLQSDNPVIISQLISGLVQNIIRKGAQENPELPELKILKDKCTCNDNSVSLVACNGILHLAGTGNLHVKTTLTDFIAIVTTTNRYCPTVPFLLNNLLVFDLKNELLQGNYRCPYNLRLPQHPLITLLNENWKYWQPIFQEIVSSYTQDTELISHYNELYKPLYMYTLCDPTDNQNLNHFKQQLWLFLINNEIPEGSHETIYTLLSWMQIECKHSIEMNSNFLVELSRINVERNIIDPDLLLLFQVSTVHCLIINNFNPRGAILSITNVLECHDDLSVLDPLLLTLSKSILLCSPAYLEQLLVLCKAIILHSKSSNAIILSVLKSSLLHWIANPSLLIQSAIKVGIEILSLIETKSTKVKPGKKYWKFFNKHQKILNSNCESAFSIRICTLIERWKSKADIYNAIQNFESTPNLFLICIMHLLNGLFLLNFRDPELETKVFNLIVRCTESNRKIAPQTLTLILHKITKASDPKLQFLLLKTLPRMGVVKDNLQSIINTIEALKKGSSTLKTFSSLLMLDLWKIENKTYPYLEKFLINSFDGQDKWGFHLTRAQILKELCALRPELYGKDMVAHLSRILNECNNDDGALACALAVDAINLLCKHEVIDIITTWNTLLPMFKDDRRISVIKSICGLIKEMPNLSYTETAPNLLEEVVEKLWDYLSLNTDKVVWTAAFDALTSFSTEQIVAKMNDKFLDEETLTLRKAGHPIPGQCWIELLRNCDTAMTRVAGDFLIKLVSLEISGYLKFVYQVKGQREPLEYSLLPTNSVVRGIAFYIKNKVLKWKTDVYREVYIECLRIFSQEYSKPLPPLDWCFLQELVHEPKARDYCISIAAHQVVLSGTARRFIVNFIEAVTQNIDEFNDVLSIYKNLKFLANSVQPITLKPFFEVTIARAVDQFRIEGDSQFGAILSHVQEVLADENIQDTNKSVIGQILTGLLNGISVDSELFNILLPCLILLPQEQLNEISSPKGKKEISVEWYQKAIKIKISLSLSLKKSPLNTLNELIEIGDQFSTISSFIFEELAKVFTHHRENTDCAFWVFDLLGQMQAKMVENYEKSQLMFLCDIFILSTLIFSGHYIFLERFSNKEEFLLLFPRAITTLLDMNHWSICTGQAVEWFHHMTIENVFPKEYQLMFKQSLQALRHEQEFHKNLPTTVMHL